MTPMPHIGSRGVQDDLIYDIGAHLGEDSAFYLALGYRVVAIEADPQLAAKLRQRFAGEIAARRLTLIEGAISATAGDVTFHSNINPALGTTNPAFAACNLRLGLPSREVTVQGVRFEDMLAEYGTPFFLKVDIEGSDRLCVEALKPCGTLPNYLSIETSDWRWTDAVREFELLRQLGYRRFKIVRQGNHGSGTFVTRSGEQIVFSFDGDSSGPFGAYLRGRWLTMREALWRYFWIFIAIRLRARDRMPGRLLCRIPLVRWLVGWPRWYDTHAGL